MSEENNVSIVRELFEAVWSHGDLDKVNQLVDENYIGHATPHEMTLRGRAQFSQRVAVYRTLFPELVFALEDQFCSGERVCTRWKAQLEKDSETARHDSVTGEPIRLSGITITRVVGGKVVEEWDTWDTLALEESSTKPDILNMMTLRL